MSIRDNSHAERERTSQRAKEMEKEAEKRSCSTDDAILSENPLTFVMWTRRIDCSESDDCFLCLFISALSVASPLHCPSNGKSIRANLQFSNEMDGTWAQRTIYSIWWNREKEVERGWKEDIKNPNHIIETENVYLILVTSVHNVNST